MASGSTRNAISQLILKGKNAGAEMDEEMNLLASGKGGSKIDLKAGKSDHNRASESFHKRK